VRSLAETHNVPQENLLAPDTQRRVAWSPPDPEVDAVADFLRSAGARPWQVELTAPALAAAVAPDAAGTGPDAVPADAGTAGRVGRGTVRVRQ
jgi:ribonuclease D